MRSRHRNPNLSRCLSITGPFYRFVDIPSFINQVPDVARQLGIDEQFALDFVKLCLMIEPTGKVVDGVKFYDSYSFNGSSSHPCWGLFQFDSGTWDALAKYGLQPYDTAIHPIASLYAVLMLAYDNCLAFSKRFPSYTDFSVQFCYLLHQRGLGATQKIYLKAIRGDRTSWRPRGRRDKQSATSISVMQLAVDRF